MCLAIPGKIISTEGQALTRTGAIEFGAVMREASLAFVPEANEGDYVIVHAGVAISILNEEEAQRTFSILGELEEQDGEQDKERGKEQS